MIPVAVALVVRPEAVLAEIVTTLDRVAVHRCKLWKRSGQIPQPGAAAAVEQNSSGLGSVGSIGGFELPNVGLKAGRTFGLFGFLGTCGGTEEQQSAGCVETLHGGLP